ncbi:MAG: phosphatidate cytidylyltransferase [Burkholderiales bacterium]
MLKQRVITAIVLLAVIGLVVAASSPWPFLLFLAIACACAGWEWLRLTAGPTPGVAVLTGGVLFIVALLQAWLWLGQSQPDTVPMMVAVTVSAAIWVVVVPVVVLRGNASAAPQSLAWSIFGPVTLYATWAALALLFLKHGAGYVLSLLVLVWVADIAAYFAGRAFGRHKLAPRVSPGKTVEGAIAGVLGVVAWVLVSANWDSTFGASLVARWSWPGAAGLAAVLAAVSILGDLFESLLKRRAGVKDSSGLLPGHGGVYDRIDAVVAVVPLAVLLVSGSWL